MPSDANGVYSLPSGSTAVTGETIQASTHNTPIEDIASAISQRLMRSGVAPMTGPLKIVDGSVGSPAVKFSTDGTTGFYKTTNGIGMSVGGTKVAEFTTSGISRMIGELIPWTLLSAPSGWVLPYGQTLSRTTYADLWTIAQDEISNGNTFFNNGNGTTTFGIGDLRGRTVAAVDHMGGTDSARNNSVHTAATTMGGTTGSDTNTLSLAQLPTGITSRNVSQAILVTTTQPVLNGASTNSSAGGPGTGFSFWNGNTGVSSPVVSTGTADIQVTSNNTSGTAHNNIQHTMFLKFILYAGA
jgi:microcystin-dependent protein